MIAGNMNNDLFIRYLFIHPYAGRSFLLIIKAFVLNSFLMCQFDVGFIIQFPFLVVGS